MAGDSTNGAFPWGKSDGKIIKKGFPALFDQRVILQ